MGVRDPISIYGHDHASFCGQFYHWHFGKIRRCINYLYETAVSQIADGLQFVIIEALAEIEFDVNQITLVRVKRIFNSGCTGPAIYSLLGNGGNLIK